MQEHLKQLLFRLLSQPTAPFREQRVIALATAVLKDAGAPFFADPAGNLVVGASSKTDMLRLLRETSREPVRVFIAHMDHPGFHGMRWIAPNVLRVQWHGGSPVKHLQGSRVWLANDDGYGGVGVMRNARLKKHGWSIDAAEVHVECALPRPRPQANRLYGGFDFRRPVWKGGSRLYTRAADDLVGVFCILAAALEIFTKPARIRPPFLGLLTRAEEVGFVGALAHFELGWLQQARRPLVCVSLEASRTLPGAVVGKGPIVRLGDRRTPFDAAYSQVLTRLAEEVLPGRHQRRIMDGGSCEGSAATAYGFPTIAMAVPLGNYHNQGLEGGPDCRGAHGPAPEFVHLGDIEGQYALCLALMRKGLPWHNPWQDVRERLQKNLRDYRALL
ncbi:hypothetical protein F8A87_12510 [Betaproteobacteria bacterium SCN2]|jgi:endoglucanase|nr:hypothetical protein F8A87_12510 [Betaproteobacteria bacterium SCN2]